MKSLLKFWYQKLEIAENLSAYMYVWREVSVNLLNSSKVPAVPFTSASVDNYYIDRVEYLYI